MCKFYIPMKAKLIKINNFSLEKVFYREKIHIYVFPGQFCIYELDRFEWKFLKGKQINYNKKYIKIECI